MPDDQAFASGYLKGYEEGLKDAWEELISLTMKGYTSREIQILAKSRKSDIPQRIELRKKRLSREMDIDLSAPVAPKPQAEAPKPEPAPAPVPPTPQQEDDFSYGPGATVIVRDRRLEKPILALKEQMKKGSKGLCILRTPPDIVKKKHSIECSMVWLTKTEVREDGQDPDKPSGFVSPTDLPKLTTIVKSFVTENKNGVVVLEGLEYLVNQNDFKSVLKFMSTVRDQIYLAKGVLFVPLDPTVFDEKDLKALEREAEEE
ncbi:MAG TPA: DUF835 domain-containing protein [Methanomassiliicoccales archaeon]|nr:DUF835 domain-containing protein [Methanomassiliicoccales archaeon]